MTPAEIEAQRLMEISLSFVEHLFKEFGFFRPFAHGLTHSDEVVFFGGHEEEDDKKSESELVDELTERLRAAIDADEIKAATLAYHVQLTDKESGEKRNTIRINIDHEGTRAVVAFYPYRLDGRQVVTENAFAVDNDERLFVSEEVGEADTESA